MKDANLDTKHSAAFLRKRKMMMVLPVLVIPFLTMAFWALGGASSGSKPAAVEEGLNLNLPEPGKTDDKYFDKLSFYDKATKDSMKMEEWIRNDPYYQMKPDTFTAFTNELESISRNATQKYPQPLNVSPYESAGEPPEKRIMQKLALLDKEINKPDEAMVEKKMDLFPGNQRELFSDEVNRLEEMMQSMGSTDGPDPEMQQLNGTLEKILDIQHPQRVQDRLQKLSVEQKGTVFPVSKVPALDNMSLLDSGKPTYNMSARFYGLKPDTSDDGGANAIEAVVHADQTLVSGAVVKLRLLDDIYINGTLIRKNNFVFGIASLRDERLEIAIHSIRNQHSIFPVKLEVYDLDGLPGIYIPGAITRDVAKQSADNNLQLMELSSMDPSFKAQAATAGISTAKNLLSRKVKLVKVMLKGGYKIFLKG